MVRGLIRHRLRIGAVVVISIALISCNTKYGSSIGRTNDAVVLDGSALPKLLGTAPLHDVGFAWDGTNWTQVPVQVDERDVVNPGKILHRSTGNYAKLPGGGDFSFLVYTDQASSGPGYTSWPTYTGVDSDPTFDANDQLSFMASNLGEQATAAAGDPASVTASTRQEVKVSDPADATHFGYLYLYSSPTLTGGAPGTDGVNYTFSLTSGNYLSTYHMGTAALSPNNSVGPNPETSTISTAYYSQTYGDRWLNNGVTTKAGGSPGTPLLERAREQFAPGVCGRSEDTFDDQTSATPYEAAFITNVSGPVRAIRSYIGANSGQYTESTDIFYPDHEDSTIDLRVHEIPGVMAFDDMKTSTTGLTYNDDQNTGVPIDGVPDTITVAHSAQWQMVTGAAGSMVTTRILTTNIPNVVLSTYELDQNPASPVPCTGDAAARGQNGVRVTGPGGGDLLCTDPTIYGGSNCPTVAGQTTAYNLTARSVRWFAAPNLAPASAANWAAQVKAPLITAVSP